MEPIRVRIYSSESLEPHLSIMASTSGWTHIVPHNPPSPSAMPGDTAGNLHQLANELVSAYKSVQYRGPLPTVADLPHTAFVVNPNHPGQGAITYLDPHNPARATGYCFLSGSHAEMAAIKAKYKAYTAQIPGGSPLERLPLELLHRITAHLWADKSVWDGNEHLVNLSHVSKSMHRRLLEVVKVEEINQRWARLGALQPEQVMDEVNAIAAYAMSAAPVKLAGPSLLAVFKDYVRMVLSMMRDDATYRLVHRSAASVIDIVISVIGAMRSQYDQAEAFSILSEHSIGRELRKLWVATSYDRKAQQAGALVNIVANMNDADAKAEGIAATACLSRMNGVIEQPSIQYVASLLEFAENLEGASPEAMDKIGLAFLETREHLASYCAHHYDASFDLYPSYHRPEDENEATRSANLETGRKLDAFLVRNDFDLQPASEGGVLAPAITPLWTQR